MRCPTLGELPAPPGGRRGWPWTEAPPPSELPGDGSWPRISIVVPSFNQGRFLEEALRSVLLQGYPEVELIVVDGGSTDGSVAVLDRYAPWIAWWRSAPDNGQSDAVNRGFARATGDLLTFPGSDDVYEPGAFRAVARRFREASGCGAVAGAFRVMDERSQRLGEAVPARLPPAVEGGPVDLSLLDPNDWRLHQVATFFTRDALDAIGRSVRQDLRYTMDRELLYRVCRRFPVALVDATLAAFRRHPAAKSAVTVAFFEEMASLHTQMAEPGETPEVTRRRHALARRRRAHGYLRLAREETRRARRAAALVRALVERPSYVLETRYLRECLAVAGLLPLVRKLRRRRT